MPPTPFSTRLPRWAHAIPYAVLVLVGGVLLLPGVVPQGPQCGGDYTGAAPAGERGIFVHLSAGAFGRVAILLLLSALAASAQRRGRRPGLPSTVCAMVLGAVTLAAMVSPQTGAANPVVAVMATDWFGLLFGAAILAVPAVAGSIAWLMMRGPRALRAAQIGAWTTLLLTLPLIMGATYEVVSPMCWG